MKITALDTVEKAKVTMEGAKAVTIVFRIPRDQAPLPEEALKKAEEGGIQLVFQGALIKMMGKGDQITHAEVATNLKEGEEATDDNRNVVPVDVLITGSGRFPELIYVPRKSEEQAEGWETLFPYPSPYAKQDIGMFRLVR